MPPSPASNTRVLIAKVDSRGRLLRTLIVQEQHLVFWLDTHNWYFVARDPDDT